MKIRNVVNIVSDTSGVNMGVWSAATVGNHILASNGIQSWVLVTASTIENNPVGTEAISVAGKNGDEIRQLLFEKGITPDNSVVATHGSWLIPSRLGHILSTAGFKWIYVPQGMLEPWSISQKRWKKKIYFLLFEKRFIKSANAVRAVSVLEQRNLEKDLKREITLISNGVQIPSYERKNDGPTTFVFMARLHLKKGIVPLVKAWDKVMRQTASKLIICGADQGEFEQVVPYIKGNIEYRGLVRGDEKRSILKDAHYFVLPTHSEGLPSGVLEAMAYGLIPVISDGANLPEVFELNLGVRTGTTEADIQKSLLAIRDIPFDHQLSLKNHNFIKDNYSEDKVGEELIAMLNKLEA